MGDRLANARDKARSRTHLVKHEGWQGTLPYWRAESASVSGGHYRVLIDASGEAHCNCAAGRAGSPCWHAAAVQLERSTAVRNGRHPDGPPPQILPPSKSLAQIEEEFRVV